MEDIKQMLLDGPDDHIAGFVKTTIVDWSEPPTALQVLHTTDAAVHGGGASDFTMGVLDTLLTLALKRENKTYDDIVEHATWRNV